MTTIRRTDSNCRETIYGIHPQPLCLGHWVVTFIKTDHEKIFFLKRRNSVMIKSLHSIKAKVNKFDLNKMRMQM